MNNAIVTVVGTDQVGIIAKVSNFLSQKQINIADISQTILSGNFVLLDGFTILACAKEQGIHHIPVVILENVEVI